MPVNRSDEELLGLLREGDEDAFLALYRRRQSGIYRFALRMCGSESVAEDVTQEVFMHLMRGNGHFDAARGSVQAYLFGVARNQVLRRIERDRAYQPINSEEEESDSLLPEGLIVTSDPLLDLTRREAIGAVRQAVLALPAHYREVVVLCDLHEMSYQDAAQILDCAIGTVRSRLHRARAILVQRLRGLNPEVNSRQTATVAETVQCFV
ncbi:MAG TPA: sigma-70 family RNA polymerase sigma factor [Blastocatellia bacterium]|nr:sigma-70 family RNA polymerase sigma factor [Blastocatellia bacterium]HMY76739.1 sigma-70 family RNA polymerase sigma factor [Blastocatellia bacterium]HMZ20930.1 sigma-70 family RNA polymerase sigma factor [Blastocatellia bacterium]HNG31673.1 sigma-70 family RNA polymerase sigma factor [Blastocatellia bacterium]